MTLEELVEEKSKDEEYSMYDDREVICSCGNTLFFKVSYPVQHQEINIYKSPISRTIPIFPVFFYTCLYCGEEQEQNYLSKKVNATLKLLSNYDIDKLEDELYLKAIKELEEYLC